MTASQTMAAVPHPSSVRHRMRTVLPEALKDAELETLDPSYIEHITCISSNNTCHPSQPAIQQLVQGLPAESVLLLNVVAVIWGSQHPLIKMVVDDCDASAFSLVRFAFAALIASIFSTNWNVENNNTSEEDNDMKKMSKAKLTWRWGAEMGLWMFLGYAFQAIGLEVI